MKTTICPECGKIESKEDIVFLCEIMHGETKEINTVKADGIKWHEFCQ